MPEGNKNILTDEEVDQIAEVINETNADNKSIAKLHEAAQMELDDLLDDEEEDKDVSLQINPTTGKPEGVAVVQTGYGFDRETDLFDDFSTPDDKVDIDFTDLNINNVIKNDQYIDHNDLSFADMDAVKKLLDKKNKTGEVKYEDLPGFLRKEIDATVRKGIYGANRAQIGMARNMMANDIVERLYTSLLQEKISEVTVDLETSVKNLVSKEYEDITTAQQKQQSFIYLKKLPELAETKYKDDPEKKALLYAVSRGYEQAHTLENMYSAYSKGGKQMKIRKIDIEKIHKVIREFETKYEKSTFTIRDLNNTIEVLSRHVNPRFTETDIKAFIVVFCKYTHNMKPANVADHTFMYYFINNILTLDMPVSDKTVVQFNEQFMDTVNHFLNLVHDRISND